MPKVLINFSVEEAVIMGFKNAVPKRQRSPVIEQMMMSFVTTQEQNHDLDTLREQSKAIMRDIETKREELSAIGVAMAQIEMRNAQEKQERKTMQDQNLKMATMMVNMGTQHGWDQVND